MVMTAKTHKTICVKMDLYKLLNSRGHTNDSMDSVIRDILKENEDLKRENEALRCERDQVKEENQAPKLMARGKMQPASAIVRV